MTNVKYFFFENGVIIAKYYLRNGMFYERLHPDGRLAIEGVPVFGGKHFIWYNTDTWSPKDALNKLR